MYWAEQQAKTEAHKFACELLDKGHVVSCETYRTEVVNIQQPFFRVSWMDLNYKYMGSKEFHFVTKDGWKKGYNFCFTQSEIYH